jgi:hypothetical protein
MSERDYKSGVLESSSKTQRAAILRVLTDANGAWIPLPTILELRISQYGARIFELRGLGHRIENKSEWRAGRRHSWFRLEQGPDSKTPSVTNTSLSHSVPSSFPEFGSLEPERYGA